VTACSYLECADRTASPLARRASFRVLFSRAPPRTRLPISIAAPPCAYPDPGSRPRKWVRQRSGAYCTQAPPPLAVPRPPRCSPPPLSVARTTSPPASAHLHPPPPALACSRTP